MLTIIIPAFNESDNITHTVRVITDLMHAHQIPFEMVFVDDGSLDDTWCKITEAAALYPQIRGIRFSRNFGKEGAIFAGLRAAKGHCAVVIDCDLQHPPELIPEMYRLWKDEQYEVVEAKKESRGKESIIYKLFARLFYGLMRSASKVELERASDFKLLDRRAVDALLELPERLTFFRALSSWIGFRTTSVEFSVQPRYAGKTKWSFRKLVRFAMANLTSFTSVPMYLIAFAGIIFFIFSIILGVHTLIKFFNGTSLAGFSTVILLILITGSLIMIGLGIIGYYISKIYEEIKFRPRYIIQATTEKTQQEKQPNNQINATFREKTENGEQHDDGDNNGAC